MARRLFMVLFLPFFSFSVFNLSQGREIPGSIPWLGVGGRFFCGEFFVFV